MKDRLLIEFDAPEQLALAVKLLRARGFRDLDAHTPYSTQVVRDALDLPRSRLSIVVFVAALAGAAGAYYLQWATTASLYPLDVGGRPPHMPVAFVPITFEMGVLAAAFAAFFGALLACRLLRLWDPIFEVDGIESLSVDRFWLSVGVEGGAGDAEVRQVLAPHGPRRHVLLTGWQ